MTTGIGTSLANWKKFFESHRSKKIPSNYKFVVWKNWHKRNGKVIIVKRHEGLKRRQFRWIISMFNHSTRLKVIQEISYTRRSCTWGPSKGSLVDLRLPGSKPEAGENLSFDTRQDYNIFVRKWFKRHSTARIFDAELPIPTFYYFTSRFMILPTPATVGDIFLNRYFNAPADPITLL